ncbi:MAG TPA: hypothetical protein VF292_07815 [Rhodanobacteraceae bacterium]
MKRFFAVTAAVALGSAFSMSAPAATGNANKEIATALIHANVASKVDSLSGVHLHLHHVLNCVLGPHSKQYSAAAEKLSAYKCVGLGNGALPDSRDPAVRSDLQQVVKFADRGIQSQQFATAHQSALGVLAQLKRAQAAAK